MSILTRIIFIIFLVSGGVFSLQAQQNTSFEKTFKKAQSQFDKGNFTGALETLDDLGLDRNNNTLRREEKKEVLLLLSEIYLIQRNPQKADSCMKAALKARKGLYISPTKPDLYHLYRTFRTSPVFYASFRVGGNLTRILPFDNLGTGNTRSQKSDYPTALFGQNGSTAGVGFSYAVLRNVEVGLEFLYANKKYSFNDTLNTGSTNAPFNFNALSYIESQTWMDIPLMFTYTFRKAGKDQKIFPFATIGMTYNYLYNAQFVSIKRVAAAGPLNDDFFIENNLYDLVKGDRATQPLRARHNYSATLGMGAKVKVGTSYLGLDFRYNTGFNNLVNTVNRMSNPELIYRFGYVDDDIRMENYALSLSYIHAIYIPKKKKAYVTPPLYPKALYAPVSAYDTTKLRKFTYNFYDIEKGKPSMEKDSSFLPFRAPTDAEIRRVATMDALRVVDAGVKFMTGQSDKSQMRAIRGELIDLINQELLRLEEEKKNLRKELKEGPQQQIEEEIRDLEDQKDQLERRKKDLMKNHKEIIEKGKSRNQEK